MSADLDVMAAEILEDAAGKFESVEWTWGQQFYERPSMIFGGNGKVAYQRCAVGGLQRASLDRHYRHCIGQEVESRAWLALAETLGLQPHLAVSDHVCDESCWEGPIIRWNDDQGRSKDEIVAAFRKAAANLRAPAPVREPEMAEA